MRTPFLTDQTIPFSLKKIGTLILFLGVLFLVCRLYDQRQHFAVLDIQPLLRSNAEDLASLYKNGKVPPEKLQAMADDIREKAQAFAKKNHLILLDKNAVWGGDLRNETWSFLIDVAHEAKKNEMQRERPDAPE